MNEQLAFRVVGKRPFPRSEIKNGAHRCWIWLLPISNIFEHHCSKPGDAISDRVDTPFLLIVRTMCPRNSEGNRILSYEFSSPPVPSLMIVVQKEHLDPNLAVPNVSPPVFPNQTIVDAVIFYLSNSILSIGLHANIHCF